MSIGICYNSVKHIHRDYILCTSNYAHHILTWHNYIKVIQLYSYTCYTCMIYMYDIHVCYYLLNLKQYAFQLLYLWRCCK